MKKGDSIGLFLKAVREQIAPEFRELRHVGVDNLLYIKVRYGRGTGVAWVVHGGTARPARAAGVEAGTDAVGVRAHRHGCLPRYHHAGIASAP